jgi:two-component system, cell cycle response regulator DivK
MFSIAKQNLTPVRSFLCPQPPLVLVVDDDHDSLTLMAYILEDMSFQTCLVADGLAALSAARQQHPSLILSDIYLPQVDGYSLIQQLRADDDTRSIPVVAVTALASEGDRQKIIAAGFDGYISKPFLISPLEHLVQNFIGVPCQQPSVPSNL